MLFHEADSRDLYRRKGFFKFLYLIIGLAFAVFLGLLCTRHSTIPKQASTVVSMSSQPTRVWPHASAVPALSLRTLLRRRVPSTVAQRASRFPGRLRVAALESDSKLDALHEWLETKGVSTKMVKGVRMPGYGASLVAVDSIQAGDALLSVPSSLHITPSRIQGSPIGQAVGGVIPADDAPAFLALGLLGELSKGEAGDMWPYLDSLPGVDALAGVPFLWSDDERAQLFRGSHMELSIGAQRQELLSQWAAIETDVFPHHPPELFPRNIFNAPGYLWAQAIVSTRALPFGEELSIIPFLDLANHMASANNTCSIGFVDGDGSIAPVVDALQLKGKEAVAVLTAGAAIAPGEQCFIDYGETGWRSSWEMLRTYGFVPGSTSVDWLANGGRPIYFDGVAANDPLQEQKQAVLAALGAEQDAFQGMWLDLKPSPVACMSMAPLLRLAHLKAPVAAETNLDKLGILASQLASWSVPPRELWAALQQRADEKTEALVTEQVLRQCNEALAALPGVDELAAVAAPSPSTAPATSAEQTVAEERARLAARVVLGERNALEACISVWEKHSTGP